tara:strand:+ start:607 stop:1053 length:447 start_codon:yes stop_codon:yes gene_type:complete
MKKIGTHCVRGQLPEGVEERISLFDGKFTTGYRITDVRICSSDIGSSGDDAAVRISTESIGTMPASGESMIDFSDNRQIAWCGYSSSGGNGFDNITPIIDPENMVIEDLYISGQHGSVHPINYLIYLEKYEFVSWQGAAVMVGNKSQA